MVGASVIERLGGARQVAGVCGDGSISKVPMKTGNIEAGLLEIDGGTNAKLGGVILL